MPIQATILTAIIADIHANDEALRCVVRDARRFRRDVQFWCLGDIFGRGPAPLDVWRRLRNDLRPAVWLAGNWDWGLIDRIRNFQVDGYSVGDFRDEWWDSLLHQRTLLEAADPGEFRRICRSLAQRPQIAAPYPGVYLAHGSFNLTRTGTRQPGCVADYQFADRPVDIKKSWETLQNFLRDPTDLPGFANRSGSWAPPRLLAVGHTHLRALNWMDGDAFPQEAVQSDRWYPLPADQPALVNPGSVGFPRSSESKGCASYALLEMSGSDWRVCFREVGFDTRKVNAALLRYGYPEACQLSLEPACPAEDDADFIAEYLGH